MLSGLRVQQGGARGVSNVDDFIENLEKVDRETRFQILSDFRSLPHEKIGIFYLCSSVKIQYILNMKLQRLPDRRDVVNLYVMKFIVRERPLYRDYFLLLVSLIGISISLNYSIPYCLLVIIPSVSLFFLSFHSIERGREEDRDEMNERASTLVNHFMTTGHNCQLFTYHLSPKDSRESRDHGTFPINNGTYSYGRILCPERGASHRCPFDLRHKCPSGSCLGILTCPTNAIDAHKSRSRGIEKKEKKRKLEDDKTQKVEEAWRDDDDDDDDWEEEKIIAHITKLEKEIGLYKKKLAFLRFSSMSPEEITKLSQVS